MWLSRDKRAFFSKPPKVLLLVFFLVQSSKWSSIQRSIVRSPLPDRELWWSLGGVQSWCKVSINITSPLSSFPCHHNVIIIVVNIFIIIIKFIFDTRLLSADKERSTIDFRLLHLDTSWSYLDSIWFLMVSIWAFGSVHLMTTISSVWWSVSCAVLLLLKHDTWYLVRLNLVEFLHCLVFMWRL